MRQVTPSTPEKMKSLLDKQYDWPAQYTFKFLVPKEQLETLLEKVPESGEHSQRESRSGKFVSLTVVETFSSSDEVIEVYRQVSSVEGLISL